MWAKIDTLARVHAHGFLAYELSYVKQAQAYSLISGQSFRKQAEVYFSKFHVIASHILAKFEFTHQGPYKGERTHFSIFCKLCFVELYWHVPPW